MSLFRTEGCPPGSGPANRAIFFTPPVQCIEGSPRAPRCGAGGWAAASPCHAPGSNSAPASAQRLLIMSLSPPPPVCPPRRGCGVLPLPFLHLCWGPGGAVQGQLPLLQGPRPQALISWERNRLDQWGTLPPGWVAPSGANPSPPRCSAGSSPEHGMEVHAGCLPEHAPPAGRTHRCP